MMVNLLTAALITSLSKHFLAAPNAKTVPFARIRFVFVSAALLVTVFAFGLLPQTRLTAEDINGDTLSQRVVMRKTNDRDHDLIEALASRQRFDDAIRICQDEYKRNDPNSDAAAKWAIRWSQTLTQSFESASVFNADAIAQSQRPAQQLLSSYPDHTRQLFLQNQLVNVERTAARHAVVIAAVSPNINQKSDSISAAIARTTTRFADLSARIDSTRSELDPVADTPEQRSLSADLLRLHNEIRVTLVSLALLQTDLFPPESRDYLAAASQAKRAADQAISELSSDSPARLEIERLRVDALLRSGDYAIAKESLDRLLSQLSEPIPDRVLALQINLDLAQRSLTTAAQTLKRFYGDDPNKTFRSIEMDLSRLTYLIATQDKSIGQWLESIEQRHGVYARRRAELISLGQLRATSDDESIDPAIIAAQGADWLRRGDPARAANLLAAAAKAERDQDMAISRSVQAAAAFAKAGQPSQAAAILITVSRSNASATQAADAHLQAAAILSQTKLENAATETETILLQTHRTWPNSKAAFSARRWLVALLRRQQRRQEAAQVATSFLTAASTTDEVSSTLDAWTEWIASIEEESNATEQIKEFQKAFEPLRQFPLVADSYATRAVYLLDRIDLANLPEAISQANADDAFTIDLLGFRLNQTVTPSLASPPKNQLDTTRWRLMRDGNQESQLRSTIATVMSKWGGDWKEEIPLLIWSGNGDKAVRLAEQTAAKVAKPSDVWRRLATSLSASNSRADQENAISVWDRLASGLPKSSQPWHEAKLAGIELLINTGKQNEAAKRAKYILLTNSPSDESLRTRYEKWAGRP